MGRPVIVVAPDGYKGGPDAAAIAAAMARGIRRLGGYVVVSRPMADGGSGTARIVSGDDGIRHSVPITDIYGNPAFGHWIEWRGQAWVESAVGSGFVSSIRTSAAAESTTSYGTGQLIREALACDRVKTVYVGLGGTGCTDGGIGVLAAMGGTVWNRQGEQLPPRADSLAYAARIEWPHPSKPIVGLYDVVSPLVGPAGAVYRFGPQKGIAPNRLAVMEAAMTHWAAVVAADRPHAPNRPGAGAAGGIGCILLALGARLLPGARTVAGLIGLSESLNGAALCFTGEGRADEQTLGGKTVETVARLAYRAGVPCLALVGSLGDDERWLAKSRLTGVVPILPRPLALEDAVGHTLDFVERAAWRTLRLWNRLSQPSGPSGPKGRGV